jgi:uncharacterized membrane protein YhaH (DUF805 family)
LSRRGFWMVYAGYGLYSVVVTPGLVLVSGSPVPPLGPVVLLHIPAVVVIVLAIIRRFHDRGHGAGFAAGFLLQPVAAILISTALTDLARDGTIAQPLALVFSVLLMAIAFFVSFWGMAELLLLRGQPGPNRFGPDPLVRDAS